MREHGKTAERDRENFELHSVFRVSNSVTKLWGVPSGNREMNSWLISVGLASWAIAGFLVSVILGLVAFELLWRAAIATPIGF